MSVVTKYIPGTDEMAGESRWEVKTEKKSRRSLLHVKGGFPRLLTEEAVSSVDLSLVWIGQVPHRSSD